MNILNKKFEEKLQLFDEIDKSILNSKNDKNYLENIDLSTIKKSKGIKNDINNNFNNIYSHFESNKTSSLYYTRNFFSMANYLKTLKQRINIKSNNNSKTKSQYNLNNYSYKRTKKKQEHSLNEKTKKCNISLLPKKDDVVERLLRYGNNLEIKKNKIREDNEKRFKNISAPKISHQVKNSPKDPEKFVETLFYNKIIKTKDNNSNYMSETFRKKDKDYINNNFTYKPRINKKSKDLASKLGPSSYRLYKNHKNIDKEEIGKMTVDNYKNLFNKKSPGKLANENNNISKGNSKEKMSNSNMKKLINKLYNEGIQDLKKKELIHKANIFKKSEEYKKYPYQPNKSIKKKNKSNNNSFNNDSISLEKLNNDMYSKQIEWKNKKDEFNNKRKQFEEELFLSKQCTFKPNISHEYIKDDEKMIKRNLSDINNYILKRRKQIYNKKDKGFNLRDYNSNNNNKEKINKSLSSFYIKLNNNNNYNKNNKDYNKYPNTDRTYYKEIRDLNSSYMYNNCKNVNYSQIDFVEAVNALHNEIYNLNI